MALTLVDFDVHPGAIEGLLHLTMKQALDERGAVREFVRASTFAGTGARVDAWAQVNVTESGRGVIRGMHAEAMNKLVAVVAGEAFGAYVDLRPSSPTYGTTETAKLVPGVQVFVPSGVANGFQSVAPGATQYLYAFDDEWQPGMAGQACNPLDPDLRIDWPLRIDPDDRTLISAKDSGAPSFAQVRSSS